jgi:predicted alpha/beta-fold hydrolase
VATLAPFVWRRFFPPVRPGTVPWSTTLRDPALGDVRLSGLLRASEGDELLVVVHGLGGSTGSGYMGLALRAAEEAGISCLLLNVRGADLSGEDIAHAGLVEDLAATLASPALAGYRRIYLLGYSLGGHLTFGYAMGDADPRVRAVAALCSPLDLADSVRSFDQTRVNVYRKHVLRGLADIYASTHARRGGPIDVTDARRIGRLREWDERVVAPRFGFAGASDYYERASVGHRLHALSLPALYVGTLGDPMVPATTVRGCLSRASGALDVRWSERGGHLGLPRNTDLGLPGPRGVEAQTLTWLRMH